jgi:pimeloyl-ACP methyl ester carboxylesterase
VASQLFLDTLRGAEDRCRAQELALNIGADHYVLFAADEQQLREGQIFNMSRQVQSRLLTAFTRDPCGDIETAKPTLAGNAPLLGSIDLPVLVLIGDSDAYFTPVQGRSAAEVQAEFYTGSSDVTWVALENTGHLPALELHAAAYRQTLSAWLKPRGF